MTKVILLIFRQIEKAFSCGRRLFCVYFLAHLSMVRIEGLVP